MMPCLRTACLSLLLATTVAQARLGAHIDWPADLDLVTGPAEVRLNVELDGQEGSWSLQALREGQDALLLASGTESLLPGSLVFSGNLPTGAVTLVLAVEAPGASATHEARVASVEAPLAGWPFRQGELNYSALLHPMAEELDGELLLGRQAEGDREAVEMGELVWLGTDGNPLPGWPLQMSALSQALSPRSEPLLMRRADELRLAVVSKTHVLEFGRDAQLRASLSCGGLPTGEAVLFQQGVAGDALALFVLSPDGPSLKLLNAESGQAQSFPLPGMPRWSRPVLGDFSGDGQLDLLALVEMGATVQAILVDGRTFQSSLMASLPNVQWVSALSGDMNGDFRQDLVLSSRDGLVLAIDAQQELWRRDLAGLVTGPATLMDLEGDHLQEMAFLAQALDGSLQLHALDSQGQNLPFSGVVVAATGSTQFAPQLVKDQSGLPHFLLTIGKSGEGWASWVLDMDLQGQLAEHAWCLPTGFSGTPRVVDIDRDGCLDLVAGDERGRWVAWPTGWRQASPPHPRGDRRHGALFLQPIPAGAETDVLGGALAVEGTLDLTEGQVVEDLHLVRGSLRVNTAFQPIGHVVVGSGSSLFLGTNAQLSGTDMVHVKVEGLLDVVGSGAGAALMPGPSSCTPSNALVSQLDLNLLPGSHLALHHCLLHSLPRPLVAESCSLSLDSTWVLAGARGLLARNAVVRAVDCLFQPSHENLQALDGTRMELDYCVFTSSSATALLARDSYLRLHGCQFLTCQEGLRLEGGMVTVLDSVHFQANDRDLVLGADHGVLDLFDCDFMESQEAGLVNGSTELVIAESCHWDAQVPTVGPVERRQDRLFPVKPTVVPSPVFNVEPGPMVDGDEPLEWIPVEFSVGGIPIHVEYRVYRSLNPYDVVRPENLMAVTPMTAWRDPEHLPKCFYRVTASMGKQVVN